VFDSVYVKCIGFEKAVHVIERANTSVNAIVEGCVLRIKIPLTAFRELDHEQVFFVDPELHKSARTYLPLRALPSSYLLPYGE